MIDLSDELNIKLQQLINCGTRFIFVYLRRDVHISPYRRTLVWLTVRSRRLYFLGITTFNILQGSSPPYLRDLFSHFAPSVRPSRHTSQQIFLLSHISVPQPFEIHFTWPLFIFGTRSLILFAPRPPLGSTCVTWRLNWIDALYASYGCRLAFFHYFICIVILICFFPIYILYCV